ncbi:hypothetical protein G7059_01200 [Erysipelothrix sp. HDW6A]|uniref:3D domain-containing protein n=1 Tax=Erysipelothrix sp. HDW6A TaxID=2714928 RepID=UPI00140C15DF|nr:3D domain-containing protein [Erysipelothrix sp. HDW6A]QIK56554.1 hypothetical protein G7059_01200 [Erysipelothrix sp. HDW6A]
MKKYKLAIVLLAMVSIISGCSINAEAAQEITYPTLNDITSSDEEPYRFEIETVVEELDEPEVIERSGSEVVSGGASWLYAKTQDGARGTKETKYKKTFNILGELLSRVEIPNSEAVTDTKPTLYESGQRAQRGAYFTSEKITRYGANCNGCGVGADGRGSTSAGILVGDNEVRQRDGSWKTGVTYEGYYILATSSSIPLCSVVEISNHKISGAGVQPGVPFKAIVLDRGGAIQGSKLDLFVGHENNPQMSIGSMRGVKVEILSLNSRTRTNGTWGCGI